MEFDTGLDAVLNTPTGPEFDTGLDADFNPGVELSLLRNLLIIGVATVLAVMEVVSVVSIKTFNRHHKYIQGKLQDIVCNICTNLFMGKYVSISHVSIVHELVGKVECSICI